ncbi:electron transfer flavoprotein subunit beta/FixA family protein [Microbacterium terricola]|uniref:Electron transfer flavoprotein subunit beta n=1 Tax=Microbacterium terricola TaxID=344163 RepID=A0ABM8E2T2_9MICO|nr:electron transfer flavoprotein subunit beta/FixA family protein [Microbacterium terricola]UYK40217.1 electron transfer flavoprotein subunit beta/FixA family protein [Microbacterium terricola]BDV32076.1 electron transfer flavoprotein subunit beta [Microbacterium terricola]
MKIVVLVKEVPDTYGDRQLNLETGLADRDAGEKVLDEIGERALEVALSYADAHAGTEVVVVSMTPETAVATVRKGLAMGAASALQVVDDALRGADLSLTSEVLAAAVQRAGFDLVITGNQSTDGSGGVLPAMLAERLGVPQLTALSAVEFTEDAVSGSRASDAGVARISAPLPAVISITEALPDARFPNFKGIMAAKKKPFETVSLADLGVDAERADAPRSIMTAVAQKPPRGAGVKIVDEGDAGEKLAAYLIENRLA